MRRAFVSVVAAALGVGAVMFSSNDAHALGPLDLEVGLKAGVGSNYESGGPNPLGVGIGGRAGVSIFGLYGGVQAMYYLGGSQDSVSVHSTLYGIEGGYGFKLAILTIRPQIGVGNYTGTASISGGPSGSTSNLYLEPGVTGLVSLGLIYVGADINYLILPGIGNGALGNSSTEGALTVHGQVGLTF